MKKIDMSNIATRQKAQTLLCWYRFSFAVALLALSTLATLIHIRDTATTRSELLLDMAISNNVEPETVSTTEDAASVALVEATQQPSFRREVYFLNSTQLSLHDGFSASWLQRRSDFMDMHFDKIGICEDAAFRAYDKERKHKMRMTLDWMDWSVEHMSKWWKTLEWDDPNHDIPYNRITQQFTKYITTNSTTSVDVDPTFQQTIAVIAFQAYKNDNDPRKAYNLTMLSLAATIESLKRAGFGRVTVSILVEADFDIVQDAFQYLLHVVEPDRVLDPKEVITQIGHLEVGFAVATADYARTKHLTTNMPRATLLGLKDAFQYSELQESERSGAMTKNMTAWLGNKKAPSFWKYVYLTEPDTILQARPSSLVQLKAEVDKGSVLLPHRIQPMPHESDVTGLEKDYLYLSAKDFPEVIDLDPNNSNDACCDEHAGPKFKPGKPPYFEKCGNFWYACDFGRKIKDNENRHARLQPYKFIRLTEGTKIVSLAGSEHGRRCIPRKNDVCRPPGQLTS